MTKGCLDPEHRHNKDSTKRSTPPSCDGFKKRQRDPAKPRCKGRRSGGQRGPKGHTLERSGQVDHINAHRSDICSNCGRSLAAVLQEEVTPVRHVQAVPERQPLVSTDHQVWSCAGTYCGAAPTGTFPEDVKVPVQ